MSLQTETVVQIEYQNYNLNPAIVDNERQQRN